MNIKLTIEHDGPAFSGFQRQDGQLTVQGELERALGVILTSVEKKYRGTSKQGQFTASIVEPACQASREFIVRGSGRTDAGVHAKGQVVSFAWPDYLPLDLFALPLMIEGITEHRIIVKDVAEAPLDFDPRFSPHLKCYTYRFLLRRVGEGMYYNRAWRVRPDLNIRKMIEATQLLRGQHDFSAFRAADCSALSTVRTVVTSELTRESAEELNYSICGKGFLKQMVRIIAGTLVAVGEGELSVEEFRALLAGGSRLAAGQTAPPYGLTLEWVRYGKEYYWGEQTPLTRSESNSDYIVSDQEEEDE